MAWPIGHLLRLTEMHAESMRFAPISADLNVSGFFVPFGNGGFVELYLFLSSGVPATANCR